MKQVLLKKGAAHATEVPSPQLEAGEVMVRVQVSCLSIGTELGGLKGSDVPQWKRAMTHPEKILTTLKMVSNQGLKRTMNVIEEKKESVYLMLDKFC